MAFPQRDFLPLVFVVLVAVALVRPASAAVTVTGASGGAAISADTAAIGGSGSWTLLGGITIAEGNTADLSVGTNVTLVLKAPVGFELNTNSVPSVSFSSGGDITSASVLVTDAGTITITLTVASTTNSDTLVIGSAGLQCAW